VKVSKTLELSLVASPKNRRRFLAIKGEDESTTATDTIDETTVPPASEEAPPLTSDETVTDAVASVTESTSVSDATSVAQAAYMVTASESAVIPKTVADAIRHIVARANVQVDSSNAAINLSDESQVHVESLLSVIPDDAPDDIRSAAEVVQAWATSGYPLYDVSAVVAKPTDFGFDAPPMTASPMLAPQASVPQRIIDADDLYEQCNHKVRELMAANDGTSAEALYSFCRKVKKAFPDGGYVVVSGIVPQTTNVPVKQLSELVNSSDGSLVGVIQGIVDSLCVDDPDREWMSDAQTTLASFSDEVMRLLQTKSERQVKLEQMQAAFNTVGTKLPALVDRSVPATSAGDLSRISDVIQPLIDRMDRLEKSRLSFTAASAEQTPQLTTPQPKSFRPSLGIAAGAGRVNRALTSHEIVELTARRFG
jgi:hypothetical protein